MLPEACSGEVNDDQRPLIEALLLALSAFVDRLNHAEARVESGKERKP
jgi:hypothetical protein